MKTMTKDEAVNDLCKREYDWLKREINSGSYLGLRPFIAGGIGGFNKMDKTQLAVYYFMIYDEQVCIVD